MDRKLIFAFMPENDPEMEDIESAIAISYEDDFVQHGCFSYEYSQDDHVMFQGWQSAGIVELMESIFEIPKGREDYIKQYLEYNGVTFNQDFQVFLNESAE